MSSSNPSLWRRRDDRSLLKTRVFEVRGSEFVHPDRPQAKEFFVIDPPEWAVVAPVTADGRLVMVRQFRFGSEQLSLELPGGVVEPGEDPLQTAARELAEETGFTGGQAERLGLVHPNPAIQSNQAHLIVISDVVATQATFWDVDEEIETLLLPIDEVLKKARTGEITHALMLNMLFFLEPWWRSRSGGNLT